MLFFAGLALAAGAAGQEPRVSLELGPGSSIAVDQLAVLSIRVDGTGDRRASAAADFGLDNLRVVSGPSAANSLRFQDGASSHSLTLTWRLQPLAVGTARVHSASLRLDGREIPLPEGRLEIVARRPPEQRQGSLSRDPFAPRDRGGSPDDASGPARSPFDGRRRPPRPVATPSIYLIAEVDPADPFVGEQVLYTLYLFTQADVRSVNPEDLPAFRGFWSRVVPQPDQLRPKMIYREGERIGKVVLLQRALFPRRAGRFVIEPVRARMAALMPDAGPFGSLLPRTRDILRSSKAVSVDVRELPPPPAGFQGAVGQIELAVELSPAELEVGDAATLSLILSGHGHFQGLPPPRLGEIPGIRIFPPQQQSTTAVERKNVVGERIWSFVLVPEWPGSWQLPPIEIPFFDPRQERYQSASATPPALVVKDSRSQSDSQILEQVPAGDSVLPGAAGWSDLRTWLFILPWILMTAVLLAWRRGAGRRGAGRRGSGRRPQRRQLLGRLRAAAASSQPRQAAAEIEDAWRDFLHDRWQLPPGTPSTRWATLLAARGVKSRVAGELVKLADDLHYLRYAPKLSSTEELQRELVERSRKLARAVG